MKKPMILGLTGSIGMGKSAVAAMFVDEGVPVFDADATVHDLQKAGGALVPAIEAAFPGTTGPDGVDRQKLGAAVFGDRDRLALLESIIHPAVAERRKAFLASYQDADMILFDIPLLFEKGGQAGVDTVVELSTRVPKNLHTKVSAVNAEKNNTRQPPSLAEITSWIEEAKKLPRVLEY
jgi:dephospho-CoA kinase